MTTETVIDRYITIFDRAAHDPGALDELRTVFASDATVRLGDDMEPVTGSDALLEFYRTLTAHMADSKHFWNTTMLADGRLECRWVQASRTTDGRVLAMSGLEHATLNTDGLITHLRNKMMPLDTSL